MIDWAKYCHDLVSVDPENRTCVVEPGIILDQLNEQLAEHGLRYGPEPGAQDRGHQLGAGTPAALLRHVACVEGSVDVDVMYAGRFAIAP
jgi:FAD/FMN-containing dehydrogenase